MTATTAPSTKASAAPKRARRIGTRLGLVLVAGAVLLGTTACDFKEQQFIDWTNATRTESHAAPLQMNLALWMKAGGWSAKMAADHRLSHSVLTDQNPYTNWKSLGENVARANSLEVAYAALKASPGHLQNIVNPGFNQIGVGIYFDGTDYWVTQEFMAI